MPPLSESQRRGRTFFACALLLLAAMLFAPLVTSVASGTNDLMGSITTGAIYALVLLAAFRGGFLSLKIIRGCLGIFGVIFVAAAVLIGIGASMGKLPPPRWEWGWPTLKDVASTALLFYVYWAMFFSGSVRDFIARQREHRLACELQKIREG